MTPSPSRPPSGTAQWRRLLGRLALAGAMAAVLALVFTAYLNPHTVVDLANRLWSCF